MLSPEDAVARAGNVRAFLVPDDEVNPLIDQDNAGTLYSWTREFTGDERIADPQDDSTLEEEADWQRWFAENHGAALTVLLRFEELRVGGSLYESPRPNCALVFTREEVDVGGVEQARSYARGRVAELDDWLRGNCWGVVVRDGDGEVVVSVWGLVGDPDADWIRSEAEDVLEEALEALDRERAEREDWAARGVVTVVERPAVTDALR